MAAAIRRASTRSTMPGKSWRSAPAKSCSPRWIATAPSRASTSRSRAPLPTPSAVPVIASGGVGTLDHLVAGVRDGHASAVLAASIFHFGEYSIREAKLHMAAARACHAARCINRRQLHAQRFTYRAAGIGGNGKHHGHLLGLRSGTPHRGTFHRKRRRFLHPKAARRRRVAVREENRRGGGRACARIGRRKPRARSSRRPPTFSTICWWCSRRARSSSPKSRKCSAPERPVRSHGKSVSQGRLNRIVAMEQRIDKPAVALSRLLARRMGGVARRHADDVDGGRCDAAAIAARPAGYRGGRTIYLPLSRLLSLYVAATQGLFTAQQRFLGDRGRQDALHHRRRRLGRGRQIDHRARSAGAALALDPTRRRSISSPPMGFCFPMPCSSAKA